jgi:hypothetical protein
VRDALRAGRHGLRGGSTLARLLLQQRGSRRYPTARRFRIQWAKLTPLTIQTILKWADAHYARTGQWPTGAGSSGPVSDAPGETWSRIDYALMEGYRGLPGGSSLALVLVRFRGVRRTTHRPPITVRQILRWADQYHRRTGSWPTHRSGAIPESQGDKWVTVNCALEKGSRGLPGNQTLPKFLAAHGRLHGGDHA